MHSDAHSQRLFLLQRFEVLFIKVATTPPLPPPCPNCKLLAVFHPPRRRHLLSSCSKLASLLFYNGVIIYERLSTLGMRPPFGCDNLRMLSAALLRIPFRNRARAAARWPVVCEGRRVKMCVIVVVDQCPVGSAREGWATGHGAAAFSLTWEGRGIRNTFPDGLGNN